MQKHRSSTRWPPRLAPLAACMVLLCDATAQASSDPEAAAATNDSNPLVQLQRSALHLAGSTQGGNTLVVQNCNDSGNGSLRAAVAAAQSGDTVDLSQLACAAITLTTGEIAIGIDSLNITGPGADQLSIDGGSGSNHFNRVFNHFGGGTLSIDQLTVTNAKYRSATTPIGGCIRSLGTVAMNQAVVSDCVLESQSGNIRASGGGIAANAGIVLVHSKVSGNHATSLSSPGAALGGGIYRFGDLTIKYSTVSNNSVTAAAQLEGGAIDLSSGNLYLRNSTVSGNSSGGTYGGIYVYDFNGTHTARIINSTISGNYAFAGVAGLFSNANTTIANSTIAFNTSGNPFHYAGFRFASTHGTTLTLQSSIIANNSGAGSDSDAEIDPAATVTGADNLVVRGFGPLPADTITSCPLIGPLGNQGGETQTHRLLLGSPAIDAGNNLAASVSFDQRGSGYPRTTGAQTDIGAFEDQGVKPNVIFIAGFEGRCR